ncbi:MAG: hypothetical protein Q8P70_01575 [bacterium]|nr:hypothetical protein [bacterium]
MINLLSLQDKENFDQEMRLRALSLFLGILGVCFILFLGFLAILKFSLAEQIHSYEALKDSFAPDYAEESELADIVRSANTQLSSISGFYKKQSNITLVMRHLSSMLPDGMTVTHITYEAPWERRAGKTMIQEPGTIAVRGFSPTRTHLEAFMEAMNAEPMFTEVSFPPSNWVSPVNIQFSASAVLGL